MKRVGNPLITSRKLERNVRYNVIAPQGPPKFTPLHAANPDSSSKS